MPTRQTDMEIMEVIMVNLASPEARRALGSANDSGQMVALNTANQRSTVTARAAVAGVR